MVVPEARPFRIGVLSDTHGSLDPVVLDAFEGVDRIIHAGDIGNPRVLLELETIAPVTAVLGNTDHASAALPLRPVERPRLGGIRFLVVHDARGIADPGDARVVVMGHTHRPQVSEVGGVLYVNPGSVSAPRGGTAPGVALVEIVADHIEVRIIPLGGA